MPDCVSDRIPAFPLIVNDPYFSIWMPGDTLTSGDTVHWTGQRKPLRGHLVIDGKTWRFLGRSGKPEMKTVSIHVAPTATESVLEADGVRLRIRFRSPALPSDPDLLSAPVAFTDIELQSTDGKEHHVVLNYSFSTAICYDGSVQPPVTFDRYASDGLDFAWAGQSQQKVLCHSGDSITIDWGYLYIAAPAGMWEYGCSESAIILSREFGVSAGCARGYWMQGYDDIASINYFGTFCRAWYMRNGQTLPGMMAGIASRYEELNRECDELDRSVIAQAQKTGGDDYALIASASWRHTFAAHKLIATPSGKMALLSKENDSNGCIGTVDVSYPSIPLFLRFCPELVNALCRPVLEFASMPVWQFDFAPHDVGRYPHATGQVYACRKKCKNGDVYPPYYRYPADCGIYDDRDQMPVEECGNMLIMMETAVTFGADDELIGQYMPLIEKWVCYLDRYGDDPGEQLCTDDFAGHLSRNINLSAKAITGIACVSRIMKRAGRGEEAAKWGKRAREMAENWLKRAGGENGTALTFDGTGWSMKYNLIWDRVLDLGLLPEEFYRDETTSYLAKMNRYGLPLDSRADYTKSDWTVWAASLSPDKDTFCRLIAPLAKYLRETEPRVPFSDWYDTKTGRYMEFIARSVQGGVYMPMLTGRN
ncbi:MAG: glutaminase [Clostridiales bacterium]|nr:glutaminase [Clostridiales bacterium]